MAKSKNKNMYWGEEQEDAIREYILTDSLERKHELYEKIIEPGFRKIIENIYWTFSFNKTIGQRGFENIEHELIVYLYERIEKFDVTKGTKSFSFFGTIVKRWMIQQANADKKIIRVDEDEQLVHLNSISIKHHTTESKNEEDVEFLNILTDKISLLRESDNISNNDKSVLDIIISLLQNYHSINIYNKKQVYIFLKEGTDLPPRKITKTLNMVKDLYRKTAAEFYG